MTIGRSVRKYIDDDIDDFGVAAQKAESAQHIHQHTQPVILSCSGCGFEGWYGKECNNCSRSTHLVDKYTPK